MNRAKGTVNCIKLGLGLTLFTALTGCVGFVDDGGYPYYGGPVVVAEPPVVFFDGYYERGRDVHVYSHRGHESRAVAHRGGAPRRER